MERKHRALLLALPTVLTLLFFFVAPMVYILVHTLHENGFSDFVDFFGDPFYRNILWVTLRVSLVSTAISLVLFHTQIGVGNRLDGGRRRVKKYLWSF